MQIQIITACHQCDLIQYEVNLIAGQKALCVRCNALLYKNTALHYNQEIAFTISALVMLVIANLFPIATIIVQGQAVDARLFDIIQTLVMQQQNLMALLIFITLLLAPVLEVLAMTYLLMQLKWGWPKQHIANAYRLYLIAQKWVLVDVFMLGILVALVKLTPIVIVKVNIAVWALVGLIISLTALAQAFDVRKIWKQIDFH